MYIEFIESDQGVDNTAAIKLDAMIYPLEQIIANGSLSLGAVDGDFYPDTPNNGILQVNLTSNPGYLSRHIMSDDGLLAIYYRADDRFIFLNGSFSTESPLNISFNSAFGVFLYNASFSNFGSVSISSDSGVVYVYNSNITNLFLNSSSILSSGSISVLSLTSQSQQFTHKGNLTAETLAVDVTSAASISGSVLTTSNATIALHGAKINIKPQAQIEVQGLLQILDAYEFTNNIFLKAKDGLIITASKAVVNNQQLGTFGSLLIRAWSFDNNNYVNATGIADFQLGSYFSNIVSGFIDVGGFAVSNPSGSENQWSDIFTNFGVIQVGSLGASINVKEVHFKHSHGVVSEFEKTKDIDDSCRTWKCRVFCSIYQQRLLSEPIGSRFESGGGILFNIRTLNQGYSKVYSAQSIIFSYGSITQYSINLSKKGTCSHWGKNSEYEGYARSAAFNQLRNNVNPLTTSSTYATAIYQSFNPIIHAAGGFEGNVTSLMISSAGNDVAQLEYSSNAVALAQGATNALAVYRPSSDFSTLQNLRVSYDALGGMVVTVNDPSLSGGFFPADFTFVYIKQQIAFGHIKYNPSGSGPLLSFAHKYGFGDNAVDRGLVPVSAGYDANIPMLGDVFAFDQLFKDSIFKLFGSIRGINNNDLFELLASACNEARSSFGIGFGEAPTQAQINAAYNPMACPIKTNECYGLAEQCYNYKIFYTDQSLNRFINDAGSSMLTEKAMNLNIDGQVLLDAMSKITIGEEINLNIGGDVLILGKIAAGQVNLATRGNFINAGEIKSVGDLAVSALNLAILSKIEAGNDLSLESVHKLVLQTLVAVECYAHSRHYEVRSKLVQKAQATAGGKITIKAGDDVDIIGAKIAGERVFINSQGQTHIIPIELYNELTHWSKKHYYSYKSLKLIRPELSSSANEIVINTAGNILASGTIVNSGSDVVVYSKQGSLTTLNPSEYESLTIMHKKRGFCGISWLGGKTTRSSSFISDPVGSTWQMVGNLLAATFGDQTWIGTVITAHAVRLEAGTISHSATISLLPAQSVKVIEIYTKTSRLTLNINHGMLDVYQHTEQGSRATEITNIPTIFNVENSFIGNVNGTWTQLSSQIIVNQTSGISTAIINATDVILGAVADIAQTYTWLNKYGTGIGFAVGGGEFAVKACTHLDHKSMTITGQLHNQLPEVIANFVQVNATNSIRDAGAIYAAEQAEINARIIFHDVLINEQIISQNHLHLEAGIKLGVRSNIAKIGSLTGSLFNQPDNGDFNSEALINKIFTGLELYHNILTLLSKSANYGISGGVWFYLDAHRITSSQKSTQITATRINVNNFSSESDELNLVATQYNLYQGYVKTKYLSAKAGQSTQRSSSNSKTASVDIPIFGNIAPNVGAAFGYANQHGIYNFNVHIYATDRLTLEVDGRAEMSGVYVDAGSLEASFDSLLLESLRDLVEDKTTQTAFGFDPTALASSGKNLINSVSASFSKGNQHAVSALTALLGRESANIVVAHALELNGAMMANAQMDAATKQYTDHGQLTLEVGKLFIQHIYNHDDSKVFGAAVSLMQDPVPVGEQTATENHKQNKATIAPTIGDKSKAWYTKATIGSGRIIVRDNPEAVAQANRDVTRTTSETDESGFDTIYGYIPINHDYSDRPRSWEEVGERLKGAAGVAIDTVQYGATQTMGWFGTQLPEQSGKDQHRNQNQEEQELTAVLKDAKNKAKKIEALLAGDDSDVEVGGMCLIPKDTILSELIGQTPIPSKETATEAGKLKIAAGYIKDMIVSYDEFAASYPKTARYGLSAFVVTLKTAIGAVQGAMLGSLPGAIIGGSRGFVVGVGGEVGSEAFGAVAGDVIASGLHKTAQFSAPALMKADSTLSSEEAELLVQFAALSMMSGHDLASGMRSMARALKPNHAHAFADGIDIDDYHGTNTEHGLDDIALFRKEYPETVQKVGGRYPINADYAGKRYRFDDKFPELAKLYPDGIEFTPEGFPIFTPYATHIVEIEFTPGKPWKDFEKANKAIGLKEIPDGYTWHHHHDAKIMELVPTELHKAVPHTGGVSVNKNKLENGS